MAGWCHCASWQLWCGWGNDSSEDTPGRCLSCWENQGMVLGCGFLEHGRFGNNCTCILDVEVVIHHLLRQECSQERGPCQYMQR